MQIILYICAVKFTFQVRIKYTKIQKKETIIGLDTLVFFKRSLKVNITDRPIKKLLLDIKEMFLPIYQCIEILLNEQFY